MSELEDRINSVLGDPAQLERITKLAQSLMGAQTGPEAGNNSSERESSGPGPALGGMEELFSGLDMESLGKMSRVLSRAGADSGREHALLEAMKPYLSEKRRSKMDRAIKLAKLAKLAGFAMGEMESDNDA